MENRILPCACNREHCDCITELQRWAREAGVVVTVALGSHAIVTISDPHTQTTHTAKHEDVAEALNLAGDVLIATRQSCTPTEPSPPPESEVPHAFRAN